MTVTFKSSTSSHRRILLLCLLATCVYSSPPVTTSSKNPELGPSKRSVQTLATRYIDAIKKEDFDAWKSLLSPMHPESPQLDQEIFLLETGLIHSLSIEQIIGLNVELEITYPNGDKGVGFLQIHSSGHIKYTPFLFKHPFRQACLWIEPLLNDQASLMGSTTSQASREQIASSLQSIGVPLFGYDASFPDSLRQASILKTLQWLEENGLEFDATEPPVYITPREFSLCLKELNRSR